MVASTVGKLSALLAADLSDEQAQRRGWIRFCRCARATARRCSASIPPPASPGSSACWRAISARAGRLPVFSRRARRPMASAASLDEVCEHHLRTLLAQQPHGPYYLFGYSLGGTLARGLPPACASAAKRWPSSACWIPAAGDAKLGGERGQRAGSRGTGGDRPRARSVPRRPAGASLRRAVQRHRRQLCRCGAAVNHRAQREV